MRTIETTIYTFEELSESAKKKAIEKYREKEVWHSENEVDYWQSFIDRLLGYESKIYFSGFWSQGDGASFESKFTYNAEDVRKLKQEYKQCPEPLELINRYIKLQKQYFYQLFGTITQNGRYYHEYTMSISYIEHYKTDDIDLSYVETELLELFRDIARMIYKALEADYEYCMSDENIIETIKMYEYEFLESGERA